MNTWEHPIDLNLWLDVELIHRQTFIKRQFIYIFELVGNSFPGADFSDLSRKPKAAKISRGNNLHGLPYQVLDLIRDFNQQDGVNIRLLNWTGVGFFITLLLGKSRTNPIAALLAQGFSYGLSESQWDYPELILDKNLLYNAETIQKLNLESHHWIKELKVNPDVNTNAGEFVEEVKKILAILRLPSQQNRN